MLHYLATLQSSLDPQPCVQHRELEEHLRLYNQMGKLDARQCIYSQRLGDAQKKVDSLKERVDKLEETNN